MHPLHPLATPMPSRHPNEINNIFAAEFSENTGQTTLEWKAFRVEVVTRRTLRKGHHFSEEDD